MQMLDDIWASFKGNATTRIKDPVIGTFILSWCLCNWEKLAHLFFGSSPVDTRIKYFADSVSFTHDWWMLWDDKGLLIFPLLLTLFYLFALPWISYRAKELLKNVTLKQHDQSIEVELKKHETQLELNKAKLKANPEKDFLSEALKLDLEEQKNRSERRHKIIEFIDKKKEAQQAIAEREKTEAEDQKVIAEQNQIELDRKKIQAEREKQRFKEQTAIHEMTMASNRVPAVFYFLDLLSKSLKEDEIVLTFFSLSECIAALFGYASFQELINDKNFNNERMSELKYIYLDDSLSKKLDEIIEAEQSDNEDVDSSLIFDHIYCLFDGTEYEVLSAESLSERLAEKINENSYELLQTDELAGAMAETNTFFEEVELNLDDSDFVPEHGFKVEMSGSASGSHRKEHDIRGQDLSVSLEAWCKPVLGKYGLKNYEIEDISGSPRHYE